MTRPPLAHLLDRWRGRRRQAVRHPDGDANRAKRGLSPRRRSGHAVSVQGALVANTTGNEDGERDAASAVPSSAEEEGH